MFCQTDSLINFKILPGEYHTWIPLTYIYFCIIWYYRLYIFLIFFWPHRMFRVIWTKFNKVEFIRLCYLHMIQIKTPKPVTIAVDVVNKHLLRILQAIFHCYVYFQVWFLPWRTLVSRILLHKISTAILLFTLLFSGSSYKQECNLQY